MSVHSRRALRLSQGDESVSEPKRYKCSRCGSYAIPWGKPGNWKHATGNGAKGCGRSPDPVDADIYEAQLAQALELARQNHRERF